MTNDFLSVEGLWVEVPTTRGIVHPINGFNLSVKKGERFGLVGESGSGKTTAAWAMLGMTRPPGHITQGRVSFRGNNLLAKSEGELRVIRGKELSMITTNPRSQLSPVFRVGDQVARVFSAHTGASVRDAWQKAVEMLEAVGIPDPERRARAYPHEFSGGMAQRVLVAIALICSPEMLIADDATNGLDVTVQAQVLDQIDELVRKMDSSVLYITHDLGIVAHYCDTVAIMYAGQVIEQAPVKPFFAGPLHPYSVSLLSAVRATAGEPRLFALSGPRIDLRAIPTGCPLHPRCPLATDHCRTEAPEYREIRPGHSVRCHRAEEILSSGAEAINVRTTA